MDSSRLKPTVHKNENINTWLRQINEDAKAAVSIDCVIFGYQEGRLKVLAINCDMPPYVGHHSLVGDLVRSDEHLKEGANRILREKTGLTDVYMEQVQAFGIPDRHPLGRVISIAYFTLISVNDYQIDRATELSPHWIDLKEINVLAFDHQKILNTSLKVLRERIRQYPIALEILDTKFTLIQLQQVLESVLAKPLDKRNFRRKVSQLKYLIALDETEKDVNHRPAKLYTFDFEVYKRDIAQGINDFNL